MVDGYLCCRRPSCVLKAYLNQEVPSNVWWIWDERYSRLKDPCPLVIARTVDSSLQRVSCMAVTDLQFSRYARGGFGGCFRLIGLLLGGLGQGMGVNPASLHFSQLTAHYAPLEDANDHGPQTEKRYRRRENDHPSFGALEAALKVLDFSLHIVGGYALCLGGVYITWRRLRVDGVNSLSVLMGWQLIHILAGNVLWHGISILQDLFWPPQTHLNLRQSVPPGASTLGFAHSGPPTDPAPPGQDSAGAGRPAAPLPPVGGGVDWVAALPQDIGGDVIEVGSLKAAAGNPFRRLAFRAKGGRQLRQQQEHADDTDDD